MLPPTFGGHRATAAGDHPGGPGRPGCTPRARSRALRSEPSIRRPSARPRQGLRRRYTGPASSGGPHLRGGRIQLRLEVRHLRGGRIRLAWRSVTCAVAASSFVWRSVTCAVAASSFAWRSVTCAVAASTSLPPTIAAWSASRSVFACASASSAVFFAARAASRAVLRPVIVRVAAAFSATSWSFVALQRDDRCLLRGERGVGLAELLSRYPG